MCWDGTLHDVCCLVRWCSCDQHDIAGTLSGEKAKNRRDYLLARLAVNGVIAVGEGVLVYLAVHVLGLSANHEFAMFGFTILVAFTFMFIVTFFNTWLGNQVLSLC